MAFNVRHRQRGVAILTAILIVALVTAVVAAMISRSYYSLRRTENMASGDQSYLVALSGESVARVTLKRDKTDPPNKEKDSTTFDYLGESWTTPVDFPVDGVQGSNQTAGTIEGYIQDQQGCFNLNNLYAKEPDPAAAEGFQDPERNRQKFWIAAFKQLASILGIEQHVSASVIVDWVDENQLPEYTDTVPGAESSDYMSMDPPYRAADTRFADISELNLLKGMHEKVRITSASGAEQEETTVLERLKPFVCVLPSNNTAINVNTASPELLAAMFSATPADFQEHAQSLDKKKAYTTFEDFLKEKPVTDLLNKEVEKETKKPPGPLPDQAQEKIRQEKIRKDKETEFKSYVSVESQFFLANVEAKIGRGKSRLQSLIFRPSNGSGKTKVISRIQGSYKKPEQPDKNDNNGLSKSE